uniref:ParB/RepB/Spo0J family partition protein n=1 Tax=Mangrovicoccus ximenensis TaxID=1911570 RepID=UPI0038B38FC8
MQLDPEEMAELKSSIRASGLRLPVEVFELSETDASGARFGLLSGFRRLAAIRALEAETGDPAFAQIKAIVREPGTAARAYLAMVEENEIRADLSPYERGRVAVLAVSHGAFERVEDAVDGLFHAASKAKRSKIRSFALVHEELGDLLVWPEALTERAGLRLANALRAGLGPQLRQAAAPPSAGRATVQASVPGGASSTSKIGPLRFEVLIVTIRTGGTTWLARASMSIR